MPTVSIANGAQVSSAFLVERPDRPVILLVASAAANGWSIAFSATSGTGPWFKLVSNETGVAFVASFGAGAALSVRAPTPYARLETAATVSAVVSATILPG